jgi:hypothetical protein
MIRRARRRDELAAAGAVNVLIAFPVKWLLMQPRYKNYAAAPLLVLGR